MFEEGQAIAKEMPRIVTQEAWQHGIETYDTAKPLVLVAKEVLNTTVLQSNELNAFKDSCVAQLKA